MHIVTLTQYVCASMRAVHFAIQTTILILRPIAGLAGSDGIDSRRLAAVDCWLSRVFFSRRVFTLLLRS